MRLTILSILALSVTSFGMVTPVSADSVPQTQVQMVSAKGALECSDVLIIGARGSGEVWSSRYGWFGSRSGYVAQSLVSAVVGQRWVTTWALDLSQDHYPAYGVGKLFSRPDRYFQGLDAGVKAVRARLSTQSRECPSQRFVLTGYSQGAMVMHKALNQVSAATLSRIVGVELLADGYRHANTSARLAGNNPSPRSGHGLAQVFGFAQGDTPVAVADRTWTLCEAKDIVCDWRIRLRPHWVDLPLAGVGLAIHMGPDYKYPSTSVVAVSNAISRLIKKGPRIAWATLAGGQAGLAYSTQLRTADNRGGTWAVIAGALPAGLTLASATGVVSGVPTTDGTYGFRIRFTGNDGQTATRDVAVSIGPATPFVGAGTVNHTQGLGLFVRQTPDQSQPPLTTLADGTHVTMNCYAFGAQIDGTPDGGWNTNVWHHITGPSVGFVSGAYLDTANNGGTLAGEPAC